jgi:hypothetical protein
MAFNLFDIGACNCAVCFPAAPCFIPEITLQCSWLNSTLGNSATNLFYQGGGLWQSACVPIGTSFYNFALQWSVGDNDTWFIVAWYNTAACIAPAVSSCGYGASVGSPGSLQRTSFACAVNSGYKSVYTVSNVGCGVLFGRGFTQFTVSDPGNTLCPCPCWPCPLPDSNLHLAYDAPGPITGHGILTFQGRAGGSCTWQGDYFNDSGGARINSFGISCASSCTYYEVGIGGCPGAFCSGIDHPTGCTGWTFAGPMFLKSFNCSPLDIVFRNGGDTAHWEITP